MKSMDKFKKFIKDYGPMIAFGGIPLALILSAMPAAIKEDNKKKEAEKEQERIEQRGQDFARHIVSEISDSAKKHQAPEWVIERCEKDPKGAERVIRDLATDSATYANAVFRDAASVLQEIDCHEKMTFAQAIAAIDSAPALRYGPKKKMEPVYSTDANGDRVVAYMTPVPTGEMECKGTTREHILSVNKSRLTDVSLILAEYRKAQAMTRRNR